MPLFDIRTVEETGSTNADMLALAREGEPEGVWLRAERQTAGRGRLGRVWEGGDGNLYASTLVRLRPGDPAPSSLALVAGVAVHQALAPHVQPDAVILKWPNDVMARTDNSYAKLSGMLLERVEDAVVIGIGVNVRAAPDVPGRATTCLATLGSSVDAATLCGGIATAFASWRDVWRNAGLAPVRTAWLAGAHPPGTPLDVALPDGSRMAGAFDTLNDEGSLILRLANGQRHAIHAGDIFLP